MKPLASSSLHRHLVVACWLSGITGLSGAPENKASNPPEDTGIASGVWRVPRDFLDLTTPGKKAEGTPDPFATENSEPDKPRRELPSSPPLFHHVVPALGGVLPADVRELLKSMGVNLREYDLALYSHERALLFVRAAPDQVDLVAVLIAGGDDGQIPNVDVTFTLRRIRAGQGAEDLLTRTITCRNGQRAKFQRHRGGKPVEEEEIEVVIGDDGWTIDLNSAVEMHLEKRVLKASAQDLLRSGDIAGHVLVTSPDESAMDRLELSASAIIRRVGRLKGLAGTIDRQIQTLPAQGGTKPRSGLYYIPYLTGWTAPEGPAATLSGKLPACMGGGIIDLRRQLQSMKAPLGDQDLALYAPGGALLFLRAGEPVHQMLSRVSSDTVQRAAKQVEVSLLSQEKKPGEQTSLPLAPRSLLVRGGQKASASTTYETGSIEKLEIEGSVSDDESVADLTLSAASFRMGDEEWTLTTQAMAPLDDPPEILLVSGMAKDAGAVMRDLRVSTRLRYNTGLETVLDPKRRQAAIDGIEAVLKESQK